MFKRFVACLLASNRVCVVSFSTDHLLRIFRGDQVNPAVVRFAPSLYSVPPGVTPIACRTGLRAIRTAVYRWRRLSESEENRHDADREQEPCEHRHSTPVVCRHPQGRPETTKEKRRTFKNALDDMLLKVSLGKREDGEPASVT